jgi:glutathione S-transferase
MQVDAHFTTQAHGDRLAWVESKVEEGGKRMKLYYMPGTCALAVHIVLEWIGAPYEDEEVERSKLKSPEYLALNANGVVPTLIDGTRALVEASAILMHLADTYPARELIPPVGTAERYDAYRWVVYFGGTLHPHFWPYFAPGRYTTNAEHESEVRAAAELLIGKDFELIDRQLSARRFVLGDRKSIADAYLFPMARWGYRLKKPTSAYGNIHRFVESMAADPGVRAAMARHRMGAPL